MRTALSIAGSDSSGGAGIQADLKTMTMNGVFAMTAITALTAQNTTGVQAIQEATPDFLRQQLDSVFTDIRPEAVQTLERKLLPLALVITPNIPEAELLSGRSITGRAGMETAARAIGDTYGCAVLLKGGHSVQDANDLLYDHGSLQWFEGARIANPNTHGTGCTLSSAIAANLAKGFSLPESVERGKAYISGALGAMLDLGQGSGPMNHAWTLQGTFAEESV